MANSGLEEREVQVLVFPSCKFAAEEERRMLPTQNALAYVKPYIVNVNYPTAVWLTLKLQLGSEPLDANAKRWCGGSYTDITEKAALRVVEIWLIQRDAQLDRLIGRGIRAGDVIFLAFGKIGALVLSDNSLYYLDENETLQLRGGFWDMLGSSETIEQEEKRRRRHEDD